MDCRPHAASSVDAGLTISGGRGARMGSRKKGLSPRDIDSRGAYVQHAGPVFCAPRDSFPSGNRELFSGGVLHKLEGNRHRVHNDIITTYKSCSRDALF